MKSILSGISISLIAGLIIWGAQSYFYNDSSSITTSNTATKKIEKIYQTAILTISSLNSDVKIHKSKSGIPYQGGLISSLNSDQIVYLPKGQALIVNLRGMNSDLLISKSIADQVSVNNSSSNSDVILF